MAGTRLRIIVSFLVPFVLWAGISCYLGLRNDLLTVRLWPKPGQAMIQQQQQQQTLEATSISQFPPLTILVEDSSQAAFWNSWMQSNEEIILPMDIQVSSDRQAFLSSCRSGKNNPTPSVVDLIICPSEDASNIRLVWNDDGLQLYHVPADNKKVVDDEALSKLLKPHSKLPVRSKKNHQLQITLLLEQGLTNWKTHVHDIQEWLDHNSETTMMMCGIGQSFVNFDTVEWVQLPTTAVHLDTQLPVLSKDVIISSLSSNSTTTNPHQKHAYLYLPLVSTTLGTHDDGTVATTARLGDNEADYFMIANPDESSALTDALETLLDHWMWQKCLGWPMDDNCSIDLDTQYATSWSSWYEKMWVYQSYMETVEWAALTKTILLQLPSTVAVPETMAEKYLQAINYIQAAHQALEQPSSQHRQSAMELLEHAQAILRDLDRDASLVEPLDFPLEQYAAIFAPMLFPLFLPMLATLRREYKRYKELVSKKDQEEQASQVDASEKDKQQ